MGIFLIGFRYNNVCRVPPHCTLGKKFKKNRGLFWQVGSCAQQVTSWPSTPAPIRIQWQVGSRSLDLGLGATGPTLAWRRRWLQIRSVRWPPTIFWRRAQLPPPVLFLRTVLEWVPALQSPSSFLLSPDSPPPPTDRRVLPRYFYPTRVAWPIARLSHAWRWQLASDGRQNDIGW
jgi:hypothetical protein